MDWTLAVEAIIPSIVKIETVPNENSVSRTARSSMRTVTRSAL